MLWLSVGVNQRKLGGAAELAAEMKSVVDIELLAKVLGIRAPEAS